MLIDILSDLHVDSWSKNYDWKHHGADIAVVAGDISDHNDETVETLHKLADQYETVLFIDGNHEHQLTFPDIHVSTRYIKDNLTKPNVHFLFDHTHIIGDTAFVAQNGWWDYRFGEPVIDVDTCRKAAITNGKDNFEYISMIAEEQAIYMKMAVGLLQDNDAITNIVLITHTLPHKKMITWDIFPQHRKLTGCFGNSDMVRVFEADTNNKISTWIFGHNHDQKDRMINGCRFISNPRGRPDDFGRVNWEPKTIEI